MPTYKYVVNYIQNKSKILAIVTLPENLFQPNTHAKCCVVICQKYNDHESRYTVGDYNIFMADAKWCGHDSRGNPTVIIDSEGNSVLLDDIPAIAEEYKKVRDC